MTKAIDTAFNVNVGVINALRALGDKWMADPTQPITGIDLMPIMQAAEVTEKNIVAAKRGVEL